MELHPIRKNAELRFQPGERRGRLTVLEAIGSKHFKSGVAVVFRCRCDCGEIVDRDRQALIKPGDHCCPICRKASPATAPPGSTAHPLQKAWWHMINRCTNPKNKSFKNYGGRGIAVSPRWVLGDGQITGFECFVADMGPRPDPALTIERDNNELGYEPGNCRWATRTTQSRNRRGLRLLTVGDRTEPASVWSAELGVPYFTLMRRLGLGWDAHRALTEPVRALSPKGEAKRKRH